MTDSSSDELHVRIGQVKVGRPGQTLNAILGSCIGIGFLHKRREIYGLAHCLLAKSPTPTKKNGGGRHVDQAIESLLSMMEIGPKERRQLHVVLVGGANLSMPAETAPEQLVGSVNARFALKAIRAAGLRIVGGDLEGTLGRRITIDCDSGEYAINNIPRLGGTGQ